MWVRTADASSGSPSRRAIDYRNPDVVNTSGVAVSAQVRYHTLGSGGPSVEGYYFWSGSAALFGPYDTAEEAKAKADAILQPLYIDLP